jgi:hypothetical protein
LLGFDSALYGFSKGEEGKKQLYGRNFKAKQKERNEHVYKSRR